MPRGPKKPFLKRVLELRMFLLVNIIVLFFLSLAFGKEFLRNYTIQQEIADLQAQADDLAARNMELSQLNTAVRTETFYEREARLKIGLQKPGETLVIVEEPEISTGLNTDAELIEETGEQAQGAAEELAEVANIKKWWYYFFDKEMFELTKKI